MLRMQKKVDEQRARAREEKAATPMLDQETRDLAIALGKSDSITNKPRAKEASETTSGSDRLQAARLKQIKADRAAAQTVPSLEDILRTKAQKKAIQEFTTREENRQTAIINEKAREADAIHKRQEAADLGPNSKLDPYTRFERKLDKAKLDDIAEQSARRNELSPESTRIMNKMIAESVYTHGVPIDESFLPEVVENSALYDKANDVETFDWELLKTNQVASVSLAEKHKRMANMLAEPDINADQEKIPKKNAG